MMADAPHRLFSVTLAGPGSPYGFGGTRDAHGQPTYDDFAGSGGGLANPVLYQGLLEGNRSLDSPFSPRSALRLLVWGPPFVPEREEAFLDAMFQVQLGEKGIPGDKISSPNWPYVAPGKWGHLNAMSPRYIGNLIERIVTAEPKTKVLWIYGADDVAVSNHAASDPGTWGPTGRIPGYPGPEEYPPQPMMDQIRTVLDDYARCGGAYDEVAVQGSGHVPFLSHQDEFNRAFHAHLEADECAVYRPRIREQPMNRLTSRSSLLILSMLLLPLHTPAAALNIDTDRITVSGLSAGGQMAHQLHIAYPDVFSGAGIIAGGPFGCADGSLATAMARCIGKADVAIPVDQLSEDIRNAAGDGRVADVGSLAEDRVWLFHGALDTIVAVEVSDALAALYRDFIPASQIVYLKDIPAGHNFPANGKGHECTASQPPFCR